MANPYHDGTGRFCSKGEMKQAIALALKENKIDEYFTLRKEYEDISKESLSLIKPKKEVPAREIPAKTDESISNLEHVLRNVAGINITVRNKLTNLYNNGNKAELKAAIDTFNEERYIDKDLVPLLKNLAENEDAPLSGKPAPAFSVEGSFIKKLILSGNPEKLCGSAQSEFQSAQIVTHFEQEGIKLDEHQKDLLADSFYHIRRAGYHQGVQIETAPEKPIDLFEKQEAAEHIIGRLNLPKVPLNVYPRVRKVAEEAWDEGVNEGQRDS